MSIIQSSSKISKNVVRNLKEDTLGFVGLLKPKYSVNPGLHSYNITRLDGYKMRIHLRIEPDGAGVMFIDVTEVIHLNSSAAIMSKLALDGVIIEVAKGRILKVFPEASPDKLFSEIDKIYSLVDHFKYHEGDCLTCSIKDFAQISPLFSIPVNSPYKVDIALTYGCNNECPHCYNESDRLSMPSLPLDDWFAILDKIHHLGIPHVILTGGEATLHPDLPDIIHYADTLGMIVGLNTNGRHIAHTSYMSELAEAGLNHVQVTLGSNYPEVHNAMMGAKSFNQTVRGIESAINSGIHVITNTTLMRANVDHADEIINFLFEIGIKTFAMNGMIYSGGGFDHSMAILEDEMPPILAGIRDQSNKLGMRFLWYTPTEYCRLSPVELEIGAKRCNAGEYSMCIEPNGDVLPCQSYYVSAGNILTDPWEEIWDGELFRSFRDREDDPKWAGLPEKCWECPDLSLCGGGCRIEREARDGVRSAHSGGGGCSGCSGSCGTGAASMAVKDHSHTMGFLPTGGYIPTANQINLDKRSTGIMPLIQIENQDK